jgi:hypothetical protein
MLQFLEGLILGDISSGETLPIKIDVLCFKEGTP